MQPRDVTVAAGAVRRPRRPVMRVIAGALLAALMAASCTTSVELERVDGDDPVADGDGTEITTGDADAGTTDDLADVYADVADSIVFIEADETTGTGIAIEGGWILTNAHVVERLTEVRLGAFDGSDLGVHPVFASDWLFDLALIGPIADMPLEPFPRVPSADLAIGDPVMLIGFPDESNLAPTPTLTAGVVSRRRQPALGDFPFLQVDATIAPGQSGGALVDTEGDLVGISGLEFGEGEFGLVFEADAMWPRIDRLIDIGPIDPMPTLNPVLRVTDEVGPRRTVGFVMDVDESGRAQVLVQADADVYIDVRNLIGTTYAEFPESEDPFVVPFSAGEEFYFIDEQAGGGEELATDLPPGSYEIIIGGFVEEPVEFRLTSENELRPYVDVEEGAELPTGEVVEGVIDWSGDSDRWVLPLVEGDDVTITADGIADTIVAVRLDGELIAGSDDEFIGLFGFGSQLSFSAPSTGDYEVEIGSFDAPRWGYLVQAEVN